jgi:hypothetical protein
MNGLMDYKGYGNVELVIEPNKIIEAKEDTTAIE